VSLPKTDKLIEIQFGLWTPVGPRNHVLGQGPDPPRGRSNFGGTCPTPLSNRNRIQSVVEKWMMFGM